MQYLKYFLVIALLVLQQFYMLPIVSAVSSSVIISQLQTGGSGTGTAGQEFIELYNNSASDIDITGWCTTYASSSDASQSTIACMNASDTQTKLFLKTKSYMTFVSPDFATATGFRGDGVFSYLGGISGTSGHVRLLDAGKNEIDKVAWGTAAIHPETTASAAPAGGKALSRSIANGIMQDTDNNSLDFVVVAPTIHTSTVYEVVTIIDVCPNIAGAQSSVPNGMVLTNGQCVVPPPVDVCPNITGAQSSMPSGYLLDGSGNCYVDQCANIVGLQIAIPPGYTQTGEATCMQIDECVNMSGQQLLIPEGYRRSGVDECVLDLVSLRITEMLPNAAGSDTGNEYIELYNPTDKTIDLGRYALYLGDASTKRYAFPTGAQIPANSYRTFSDNDMKFSLVNSTSRVTLVGSDGTFVDRSEPYTNPPEDESWALIDGIWQFTNQLTPHQENVGSIYSEPGNSAVAAILNDCPTGKYRNPLTNRCRNIVSDVSVLASCDGDQYRNPETGRCRKIAVTATLAACRDDQYRSEETNRCRKIEAAVAPAPCKEGQERNPDTNRCRNVAVKAVPAAAFAVQPVKDSAQAFIGWWALGGIGLLAVGYAGWEWRREIVDAVRKVTRFGH